MKFTLKNAQEFGWDGLSGWAFNAKEDFPRASAAYFEITGQHGETKATESDRIYYVIDGEGEFMMNGETIKVGKSDVFVAPKNTTYDYKAVVGVLKMFLVHTPAFDSDKEVTLDLNNNN